MTLEAGKEMDRRCVLGWLNEVYRHPTVAFNTYSDEQQIEFAHDALVLLKEQEAVEPKTGHWIWLQFCANEGVYCSECHTKMFDRYPMKKKLSQFCGHCGAKMDDEVEGR